MSRSKNKHTIIHFDEKDFIKANRKASREEEIAAHGKQLRFSHTHVSKKKYNRKKQKSDLKSLTFDIYRDIIYSLTFNHL